MEYRVELAGMTPDLAAVSDALLAADPAAVADFDAAAGALRVSTCVESDELLELLLLAGAAGSRGQVELMPSVCCGGCSG